MYTYLPIGVNPLSLVRTTQTATVQELYVLFRLYSITILLAATKEFR